MKNNTPDIYFQKKYGRLYEKMENGVCEQFKYENNNGTVKNLFIKRAIPISLNNTQYYDITTPYGYGGPIIIKEGDKQTNELVSGYREAFQNYCFDNNIISEFIRFHPIINNAKDFTDIYKPEFNRKTVGIDLTGDDPIRTEFSKSRKKYIGQAIRKGVTADIIKNPEDISSFKKIYFKTMERRGAKEYYFFRDDYFDQCLKTLKKNILLVEASYNSVIVAAELYFLSGKTIHLHLSGTLDEYLHLSPTNVIRYAVTKWGKEKRFELIHQGGGLSTSIDDPLFLYKKKFGMNTEFDFYISKHIWNQEIYDELCAINGVDKAAAETFPAYRI